MRLAWLVLGWVVLALAAGWSQVGLSQGEPLANVGERSNPVAQTIVEAMRSATGAEMALLGAAFFNESASAPTTGFTADDLIKSLAHPDDEVVVLSLRGAQILQALERALELYPQKNNAFLQLAGAEVRFDPKAEPGKRILSVIIAGAKLEPERAYRRRRNSTPQRTPTAWRKRDSRRRSDASIRSLQRARDSSPATPTPWNTRPSCGAPAWN